MYAAYVSTGTTETGVTAGHEGDTRAGCNKVHLALAMTTNGYFVVRVERGTFISSPAYSNPAFSVPPTVGPETRCRA